MYVCIYTHIGTTLYMQGFSHWGEWARVTPYLAKNCSSSLHLEKFPHRRLRRLTSKQQFTSNNPIKTAFLAVVIALAPFLFEFHTLWTHRSC